eukprot:6215631-Pyramimonas_sp.AAC.2
MNDDDRHHHESIVLRGTGAETGLGPGCHRVRRKPGQRGRTTTTTTKIEGSETRGRKQGGWGQDQERAREEVESYEVYITTAQGRANVS